MKVLKIIYWIATGLLCALMLFSASMYFFNYEQITKAFTGLGYPTYLVYPLAIAKILGVLALLLKPTQWLKEWAYAGFFFDILLALTAHLYAQDGGHTAAIIALVLWAASFGLDKVIYKAH